MAGPAGYDAAGTAGPGAPGERWRQGLGSPMADSFAPAGTAARLAELDGTTVVPAMSVGVALAAGRVRQLLEGWSRWRARPGHGVVLG
jgi:hypothetical protein